jgi:hypothetical protein
MFSRLLEDGGDGGGVGGVGGTSDTGSFSSAKTGDRGALSGRSLPISPSISGAGPFIELDITGKDYPSRVYFVKLILVRFAVTKQSVFRRSWSEFPQMLF